MREKKKKNFESCPYFKLCYTAVVKAKEKSKKTQKHDSRIVTDSLINGVNLRTQP